MEILNEKKAAVERWVAAQPPKVEVALATGGGAVQGGVIGALMATFSAMEPPPAPGVVVPPKARGACCPNHCAYPRCWV